MLFVNSERHGRLQPSGFVNTNNLLCQLGAKGVGALTDHLSYQETGFKTPSFKDGSNFLNSFPKNRKLLVFVVD